MSLKVFIGSDHAGFELKQHLVSYLKNKNIEVSDLGTHSLESVDYPDYANLVCTELKKHSDTLGTTTFGILVCGSGQGMCLRANKYSHIRAALVYNDEIAQLSREHNDANVICLGSRFCTAQNAETWVNIFINTSFSEGRHRQRVDKISSCT